MCDIKLMRVLAIFLYFLVCLTMALHLGDGIAFAVCMVLFLIFFHLISLFILQSFSINFYENLFHAVLDTI